MAIETPERKVLKEMIVKLKTKIIGSQKTFVEMSLDVDRTMTLTIAELFEKLKTAPEQEKSTGFAVVSLLQIWKQSLELLSANATALIGDMNLYVEMLERYSTELDNTFVKIIEMANEMAKKKEEEQRKQSEELQKRPPPSYRT